MNTLPLNVGDHVYIKNEPYYDDVVIGKFVLGFNFVTVTYRYSTIMIEPQHFGYYLKHFDSVECFYRRENLLSDIEMRNSIIEEIID